MGDKVQTIMEEMVSELLYLQKNQLLSKEETKSVIKNRKSFEYALKRRELKKVDFLRYITYEINLEQLIAKRRRIKKVFKKSALDFARVKKIYSLFYRALHHFPGDLQLWKQFIGFAQLQGSNRALSSIYAKALQYHTHNTALWIEAAQWQFSGNQSPSAARILFQRALRLKGKESVELWIEYVRMEVTFWRIVMDKRPSPVGQDANAKQEASATKERELLKTIEELLADLIKNKKISGAVSAAASRPLIDVSSVAALSAGEQKPAQQPSPQKKEEEENEDEEEEEEDDEDDEEEDGYDDASEDDESAAEDPIKAEKLTLKKLKLRPVTADQRSAAMNAFLELSIVKTVARSALETLSDAKANVTTLLTLARGILSVYADFEGIQEAQLDLLKFIAKRNGSVISPQEIERLLASAPVLLALRHTPPEEQLAAVNKAYEAAPASSELLEAQFRFFGHVLPEAVRGKSPLLNNAMRSFLQRVPTHRALLSASTYETFIVYLLALGSHQQALEELSLATVQHSSAIRLHLLHARVLIQSGADASVISEVFSKAFSKVMGDKHSLSSELYELQHLYSEWYLTLPHAELSTYIAFFKKSIKKDSEFHAEVLSQIAIRFGIEGARQAFDAFVVSCIKPTEAFLLACLDLETAQMPQDVPRIEKLYARAIESLGATSPKIWLHYARFYLALNQQEKALAVFWKARKTLTKVARVEFVNSYQQAAVGLPQGAEAEDT